MSQPNEPPAPGGGPHHPFQAGQAIIFLGDHTSPDTPGYVDIVAGVLSRFHPDLRLHLISAGSWGQTAAALRSPALLDLLTSSRPDWAVLGVGMADALREPVAARLLAEMRSRASERDESLEATFGPEHRPRTPAADAPSEAATGPAPTTVGLENFKRDLAAAVTALQGAGVRPALMSIVPLGNAVDDPINGLMRVYSRGIREVAQEREVPIVDLERAFRDMHDRAGNYKQRVHLAGPDGRLNVQGQTLIARTFLATFELLPYPGFRSR
jgi:lysophospholipase L1-like esterase